MTYSPIRPGIPPLPWNYEYTHKVLYKQIYVGGKTEIMVPTSAEYKDPAKLKKMLVKIQKEAANGRMCGGKWAPDGKRK